MSVTELYRGTFLIGKQYVSEALCDVLDMDVCHIILGRPWKYDMGAIYDCSVNTYSFDWKGHRLRFVLHNFELEAKAPKKGNALFDVSVTALLNAWREYANMMALIVKEVSSITSKEQLPAAITDLLSRFLDICTHKLPTKLPPMRDIQHQIDFVPGATLPNLPHYRLSPN
ncbi:hypothetical protein KFK09_027470 [Dendrobium nobile]|uniref:Uncharacterized protein n=1 Tax=Dendrobium nobile TaxID=94219 RepID=A0A8T3AAX4_DENNO|nr:hypothetical protein KFK09_027470 [Dendrobium nobile]